jgi:hypothetical protein
VRPDDITVNQVRHALYLLARKSEGGIEVDQVSCETYGIDYAKLMTLMSASVARVTDLASEPRVPRLATVVSSTLPTPPATIEEIKAEEMTATPQLSPAPYPKRAAWLETELALRDWTVHDLRAQGGPDWKTSRKMLAGLQVSPIVLEKTASALSKKKKQVLLKEIPPE